jgi:hypothetical protein
MQAPAPNLRGRKRVLHLSHVPTPTVRLTVNNSSNGFLCQVHNQEYCAVCHAAYDPT